MENINEFRSFNVILTSDSNKNIFPNNTASNFSVLLPENLPEFPMKVALTDIILPKLSDEFKEDIQEIYVLTNITQPIFVNELQKKVLRLIYCDKTGKVLNRLNHLIFIPLRMSDIDVINIQLIDKNFEEIKNFTHGTTVVSLLFKRSE